MRLVSLGTFLFVLVFNFQNCAKESSPMVDTEDAASVSCLEADCITASSPNVKITPHLFSGTFKVKSGIDEFNIGGDCNEGGYPTNTLKWELVLNNAVVRHSSMSAVANGTADTKCINGRFNIYVNLRALTSGDTVDRVGLKNSGGARVNYILRLKLQGLDPSSTTNAQSDPNDGVFSFTLTADTT